MFLINIAIRRRKLDVFLKIRNSKNGLRKMTYSNLLILHSLLRWVVLLFLLYSMYLGCMGWWKKKPFSRTDHLFRHWTATMGHIQLVVGILLYMKSPVVKYFWHAPNVPEASIETLFFPVVHFLMMISAIVVLTIGSAWAKRKLTDMEKFKTMLLWFSLTLLIILIAIPWPFSPFSNRPYLRSYP